MEIEQLAVEQPEALARVSVDALTGIDEEYLASTQFSYPTLAVDATTHHPRARRRHPDGLRRRDDGGTGR